MTKLCSNDCGKVLGRENKTGLCRSCFNHVRNADPEWQERRRQAMLRKWREDPAWAAKQKARCAEMARDPENRQRNRERMLGNRLWQRSSYARETGSPQRMLAGRRGSRTKLAHIPADYHQMYRGLVKKGLSAADAEAAVRHHDEVERARIRKELMGA